jgi:hypothetical protein
VAERDEVGVRDLGQPPPPLHELLAEVAQVRDRPAERRQPLPQERCEHIEGRDGADRLGVVHTV